VFAELRDDPILNAYGQCLTRNVLCVWRRLPPSSSSSSSLAAQQAQSTSANSNLIGYHQSAAQQQQQKAAADFRLNSEKELQVFWYGDEPDWHQLAVGSLTSNVC